MSKFLSCEVKIKRVFGMLWTVVSMVCFVCCLVIIQQEAGLMTMMFICYLTLTSVTESKMSKEILELWSNLNTWASLFGDHVQAQTRNTKIIINKINK